MFITCCRIILTSTRKKKSLKLFNSSQCWATALLLAQGLLLIISIFIRKRLKKAVVFSFVDKIAFTVLVVGDGGLLVIWYNQL